MAQKPTKFLRKLYCQRYKKKKRDETEHSGTGLFQQDGAIHRDGLGIKNLR